MDLKDQQEKAPELEFCPECGIGLNNQEIHMKFCQNCKAYWTDENEPEFP